MATERKTLTDAVVKQAAKMRKQGKNWAEITEETGFYAPALRAAMRDRSIGAELAPPRPRGGSKPKAKAGAKAAPKKIVKGGTKRATKANPS